MVGTACSRYISNTDLLAKKSSLTHCSPSAHRSSDQKALYWGPPARPPPGGVEASHPPIPGPLDQLRRPGRLVRISEMGVQYIHSTPRKVVMYMLGDAQLLNC